MRKKQKRPLEFVYSSLMEQRLAAQAAGYSWAEYLKLPGDFRWVDPLVDTDCKAAVIAAYRVMMDLEAMRTSS